MPAPRSSFVLIITLLTLGAQPLLGQYPPPPPEQPPEHVLMDDMWVPLSALYGDGHWDGPPWTNGVVPYLFDPGMGFSEKRVVEDAMAELAAVCGVTFVPYSSGGHWIWFRENPVQGNVSNSMVGMQQIGQFINIGANHWDAHYVIIHEIMHALGFKHEHQRIDRNQYVNILTSNVDPFGCGGGSCLGNFSMFFGVPLGPYDFRSVMHYSKGAFGIGNSTTIQCNSSYSQFQNVIGQRSYLSDGDVAALQIKYGSAPTPSITSHIPLTTFTGSGSVNFIVEGSGFFSGSHESNLGAQGSVVQFRSPGSATWTDAQLTEYVNPTRLEAQHSISSSFPTGPLEIRVFHEANIGGLSNVVTTTVQPPPCATTNELSGSAILGIEDLDFDGLDEYVVGRQGYSSNRGRVECRSGQTNGVIWSLLGSPGSKLGTSLARISDLDGDGKDDVLAGAPSASPNGAVYVLSGDDGTVIMTLQGNVLGSGPGFGHSVSAAGDLNLDGIEDIAVGSPYHNSNQGRLSLISGASGGLFFGINGVQAGERFGLSVSGGFDMNGDGRPEVVVGAPRFTGTNGTYCGRATVYEAAFGTLLASATGAAAGDELGYSVALGPSLDGSAKGLFVAGAPQQGAGSVPVGSGYARVYRYLTGPITGLNVVDTWSGPTSGAAYGYTVLNCGDWDEDGGTDFMVASPASTGILSQVFVRSPRTGRVLDLFQDDTSGDRFGWSLGYGDANGDESPDALIGKPFANGACTNSGSWTTRPSTARPAFQKLMITEVVSFVSNSYPGVVELTNFSSTPIDLTGWKVRWRDLFPSLTSGLGSSSSLAGYTIQPQETVVLRTNAGFNNHPEMPPSVQVISCFSDFPFGQSDFCVALESPGGYIVDEVHAASPSGGYSEGTFGGRFRGAVGGAYGGPLIGARSIERIWGQDSNSFKDWLYKNRSVGLESKSSSGLPRTHIFGIPAVKINEVDTSSATYVELKNVGTSVLNLRGWSFRFSTDQGAPIGEVFPFGTNTSLANLEYLVVGNTPAAPPEKPAAVQYRRTGTSFSLSGSAPYTLGLYDHRGQLVDLVCATPEDSELVHNDPRLPSHPHAFTGKAAPLSPGFGSIGRNFDSEDHDVGDDWRSYVARTMGYKNLSFNFSPDPTKSMDVRLNDGSGGGLSIIINAGGDHAGEKWSFLLSFGHLNGQGPLAGLGADAFNNWLLFSVTPPWFGTLDSRGHDRLDLPGAVVPPGIQLDAIFLTQDVMTGAVRTWTPVLMYDS